MTILSQRLIILLSSLTAMPPKKKRAVEVYRSQDTHQVTSEPIRNVVRAIHRSSTGRILQSVRIHNRSPEAEDDESDGEDDPDLAISEGYIQELSTADFADDDNCIPPSVSNVDAHGDTEFDDGDDAVGDCIDIYHNFVDMDSSRY